MFLTALGVQTAPRSSGLGLGNMQNIKFEKFIQSVTLIDM